MMTRQINVILRSVILLGGLLAASSTTWASTSDSCVTNTGGTGMGGTGIIARGTGMGGTGIQPENGAGTMQLAGRVMFSNGRIEASSGGQSRLLAKGDAVCVGDTIQSAKTASAQIRMVDDELIAVRPATRFRIDHYAYHGKSDDNIMLSLLEGACRIVSGQIGKRVPQNDLVSTPLAVIGIRGTDHEVAIVPPGMGAVYPAGVYDKVNRGVTFIRTEKGSIDIHPNQVGFVASQQLLPRLLTRMPVFYNNPSAPLSSDGKEPRNEKSGQGETEIHQGTEGTFEQPGAGSELGSRIESGAVSGGVESSVNPEIQTGSGSLSESRSLPEPQSLPGPAPAGIEQPDMMTSPVTTSPSEHDGR